MKTTIKLLLAFALFGALTFSSCRKDDSPIEPDKLVEPDKPIDSDTIKPTTQGPLSPLDYFPLEKGNYWVYEASGHDTDGTKISVHFNDSFIVIGDTVLNGNKYHQLKGSAITYGPRFHWFLRDSSGYLVHDVGFARFNTVNFNDTTYSVGYGPNNSEYLKYAVSINKMKNGYRTPVRHYPDVIQREVIISAGKDLPAESASLYPREMREIYAKGIGKIYEKTYYSYNKSSTTEIWLIRSNVK